MEKGKNLDVRFDFRIDYRKENNSNFGKQRQAQGNSAETKCLEPLPRWVYLEIPALAQPPLPGFFREEAPILRVQHLQQPLLVRRPPASAPQAPFPAIQLHHLQRFSTPAAGARAEVVQAQSNQPIHDLVPRLRRIRLRISLQLPVSDRAEHLDLQHYSL